MNALDIIEFRKKHDLSQKELAKIIGVSHNTIYNYENNGKIPKSKIPLFKNLFDTYEQNHNIVNENEVLYNIEVKSLDALSSSIMQVPLVNQYAYAGYLSGFADNEYVEGLPKIPFVLDKEYRGEYLCFEVKGDSMECDTEESIPEGSILLCRNVRKEYWRSKLHINKWDFVIVHREMGIVVKRILKHDVDKGTITLHSLNSFYNDYDVHLKDVQQIFNIVEVQLKRKRR